MQFLLRLEVGFKTKEEVTAEAVERITAGGAKQAEWWLTVEKIVDACVEAEVCIDIKSDADIVIQYIGEEYLRELVSILGS